jgi:hypothetical protein
MPELEIPLVFVKISDFTQRDRDKALRQQSNKGATGSLYLDGVCDDEQRTDVRDSPVRNSVIGTRVTLPRGIATRITLGQ